MIKKQILEALIQEMTNSLDILIQSALDAKEAATSEESKAENKYDTRGLEASYLAGAQAKRADELKIQIQKLQVLKVENHPLIEVELNGEEKKNFFILPFAGGTKMNVAGCEVQIVTPQSPVGQRLVGSKMGHVFEMGSKSGPVEYEVLSVK